MKKGAGFSIRLSEEVGSTFYGRTYTARILYWRKWTSVEKETTLRGLTEKQLSRIVENISKRIEKGHGRCWPSTYAVYGISIVYSTE